MLSLVHGKSRCLLSDVSACLQSTCKFENGCLYCIAAATSSGAAYKVQCLAQQATHCSNASVSPEKVGNVQEIVFGWPFSEYERQAYSVQAHRVLEAVGLQQIPVATPLQQLSGGYKRRVALAVQLVRRPAVRAHTLWSLACH